MPLLLPARLMLFGASLAWEAILAPYYDYLHSMSESVRTPLTFGLVSGQTNTCPGYPDRQCE